MTGFQPEYEIVDGRPTCSRHPLETAHEDWYRASRGDRAAARRLLWAESGITEATADGGGFVDKSK